MLHSVRIEPPPASWGDLIARREERPLLGQPMQHWRAITRRELLGHAFSNVVSTGHQAGFWHPGILAKYLALDRAGESLQADALVEILVDQDVNDLRMLRVPVIDSDGVLTARDLPWTHWPEDEATLPAQRQPPILAEPGAWRLPRGETFAVASNEPQCRVMGRSLVLQRTAPSRAAQFALAAAMLRGVGFANRDMLPIDRPTDDPWRERRFLIEASSLARTSLWQALMAELRHNPRAAWEAHNRAVAGQPDAGIVPLEHRASAGCEIPCWLISRDGQRHRAFEHDLHRSDSLLWPRALLMTGFVRLVLADLFIHGQGGYVYDRITEAWFAEWLDCNLAPDTMVTATQTLDFGREPVDDRELARALWLAHHVPFNVDRFLEDPLPLHGRTQWLREIESLPRRGSERRELFERMRLQQHRLAAEHSHLIESARENLRITRRRVGETALINDRTWAFALHPHSTLIELRDAVREEFNVG